MSKLAELEQKLQEIAAEIEKLKNPNSRARSWDRVNEEDAYFYIYGQSVSKHSENKDGTDNRLFEIANYNTDGSYMERIKFEQDLWRKLKRFADQNNEGEVDWSDTVRNKYTIECNHERSALEVGSHSFYHDFGQVYFTSHKIAEKAIETFKTELLEYFGG